jgi:hypothetical protein
MEIKDNAEEDAANSGVKAGRFGLNMALASACVAGGSS